MSKLKKLIIIMIIIIMTIILRFQINDKTHKENDKYMR